MKKNYEDIFRNMTDEELWFFCHGTVEESVMQGIMEEAELDSFMHKCCKLVEKIARIPVLGKAAVEVNLLCSMVADHFKKEYRLSGATLGTITAALGYLALPIDLIPDALPVIGMLDDVKVLTLAFAKVADEVERYKQHLYSKNREELQEAMSAVASERSFYMPEEAIENDDETVSTNKEVA